jgi:cell division protein ZapE
MRRSSSVLLPSQHYAQGVEKGNWLEDEAQQKVVQQLDHCFKFLQHKPSMLSRLTLGSIKVPHFYLWGPPGSGKTMLMDTFFALLPFSQKKRVHLHPFLDWLHEDLKRYQGTEDPLLEVARDMGKDCRLLCFDECSISDIGNAMLLGRLLRALAKERVLIIATSNEHPLQLYQGGLQRQNIIPTLEWMVRCFTVTQLGQGIDYRQRHHGQVRRFWCSDSDQEFGKKWEAWLKVQNDQDQQVSSLVIHDREIALRGLGFNAVWFDFKALCMGPRQAKDYQEIAMRFATVFISELPMLGDQQKDAVARFIILIDIFYEQQIRLFIQAEIEIEQLYAGQHYHKKFKRTASRLQAMQTEGYIFP